MKRSLTILILLLISTCIYSNDIYDKVVRTKAELCDKPKNFNNTKELSEGTLVEIIDTTPIYGYIYGKKSPWIKIKTKNGETGYVLLAEIATLKDNKVEKEKNMEMKSRFLPDFKKYISKSYINLGEIDSVLHSVEFISLDSNYSITACVYGPNENYNIFLFSKLTGYNAQNPINKLSDVLVVDKRLFKNISAISLRDCSLKKNTSGSIIGIYYLKNADRDKNIAYTPEKAWLANVKTGKIEDYPADQCSCIPEPVGR